MEDKKVMVTISDVSMRFRLTENRATSMKEFVTRKLRNDIKTQEFWALKHISFEVYKGEVLGIIGRNGSGKSTTLKIISGIMKPTEGTVKTNGVVAPMLELGSGFDMDMSGRENIYLNGAVLGHDRHFMNQYFDDIIGFSELGEFIDVPVKNFSSGMVARLGFAIATVVKADVLIVDEVLAVGDARFQEKCRRRIKELMSGGTTLLFVSHNNELVQELCDKAVWLKHGKIQMIGNSKDVCMEYAKM